ncbi:tetratricopeptide repeat protein [Carboxylicivirga caseinilyticus]|uniref:tetratricopeptide repeat protein n=1 Tax=Carboxylicivirga caseinilyticus TaxID=3417572 RepID=UPI003D3383E5|nr:hypothetical protein [Marinilabiliaceae bacterium A049]
MKIVLSVFLFLVSFSLHSQSNEWLSSKAQLCLSDEYQYNFSDFGSLNEDETYYLSAYRCFLQFVNYEDEDWVKSFEKEQNRLLKITKTENQKVNMMLINLDVQLGLMQVMKGDEITGVYNIYKAYKSFEGLDKNQCDALEYQKLHGLFLIFADQVENQYGFLSWLFGIEGDSELGFQLLRSYISQTKYKDGLHTEGLLLLAYSSLQFSNIERTELEWLLEEAERYGSPVLSFVVALNAVKINESKLVFDWIHDWKGHQIHKFPLLGYIKGRFLLNELKEEGIAYLEQYCNDGNRNRYYADAIYRIARFCHVKEEGIKRNAWLSLIDETDNLTTSLDRQAKSEYGMLKDCPVALVKARFLIDGGDYLTAISVLNTDSINKYSSFYEIEWWYRLARAEHLLNNYKQALMAYDKVISLSGDDSRYFGPYSALFASEIMVEQKSFEKAHQYLQWASDLNTGEYQKEITIKIDAALKKGAS